MLATAMRMRRNAALNADVDDLQWRETLQAAGGANNKAKLWPVAANGFQDLVSRKQEQVCSTMPI